MKKLIIIIALLNALTLSATKYYVAPSGGSDSNNGSIGSPWATWVKAFNASSVSAGDTIYFRGGTWSMSVTNGQGISTIKSGSAGHVTCYFNYPGETPIMDASNVTNPQNNLNFGIDASPNYVHVKGLTLRNVIQTSAAVEVHAWNMGGTHSIYENCTIYNSGGAGVWVSGGDDIQFINCDSYNNVDNLTASYPGNDGYGFAVFDWTDYNKNIYFHGCRAWKNGDDGFMTVSNSHVEFDSCWAFCNGKLQGEGQGFKLGWIESVTAGVNQSLTTNCVAAYNRDCGVWTNDQGYVPGNLILYNNTAYHNGYYPGYTIRDVTGFNVDNTSGTNAQELLRVFKNNISYDNEDGDITVASGALYTHDHNSWDIPITVTDADFLSVDSTGLTAARQADGSLPDNDCYNYFLKLDPTSDLIDAGVDVGIDYSGAAPDLGYVEYADEGPSTATDIISFTLAAQTGAATINATTHTVAIEVAYTANIASLTPTITVSTGATIYPTSGTTRNFTNPVTYTVTAEDAVTEQVWTVTVTQEEEPVTPPGTKMILHNGKFVMYNGKFIIIEI
jgi:hypothetical protein